jgi:acyl-CoA synthetase (NDP forming)
VSLSDFRDPAAVTVVGASTDPAKWGHWLARGALRGADRRVVHLVNARGGAIEGHPCVRSLAEVDGELGLVVLCVPAAAVPAAVREALGRGARAFLCITAGLTSALGPAAEEDLVAELRRAGARMIGPNCLGIYDAETRLQLAWGEFTPGRLGIVSQSGQLGSEIADLAAERGLGVSRFVSVGNQADVTAAQALADLADHASTAAVALYVESFTDGALLLETMHRLRQAGKPVLVLTVGASAASQQAAVSHTGSLTSGTDVVEAACRAAGALRVDTPAELVDVARVLTFAAAPAGPRVGVVGDSGGQGALAVDVLARAGLETPVLPGGTQRALAGLLPAEAGLANPVDLAGAGEADLDAYAAVLGAVAAAETVDAVVFTGYFGSYGRHNPLLQEAEEAVARRIAQVARQAAKPVLVHAMSAASRTVEVLREAGVPTYHTIEDAARALAGAVRLAGQPGRALDHREDRPEAAAPATGYLAARALLQQAGVSFPAARPVATADDVRTAAAGLRAPYVLKADWIAHKTEHGAVAVGLADAAAAEAALADMVGRLGPGTYVLEEMDTRPAAVEMIVGARRDPMLGPVVMVGTGGVEAELWRDTALELAPVDAGTATAMIRRLRGHGLLAGWRGRPGGDVEALAEVVTALSRLMAEAPESCQEIELNPVRVGPDGALAVDALIHLDTVEQQDPTPTTIQEMA